MEAASPTRFLRVYSLMTTGLLVGVVLFNAVVDPLLVYHAPWLPQRYVDDQRQSNPGIARFAKYDAVVIGNSLSENFLDAEMRSTFGWNPLKLSIKGSTAREQRLVLDQALATGQVRDVLWGLDYFSYNRGPDAVANPSGFPFHLYERNISTPFKYLLSTSTLLKSMEVLVGVGARSLTDRCVWHHRRTFSTEQVLKHWRADVSRPVDRHKPKGDAAWKSLDQRVVEVVRNHPEVRFRFFFAPYSAIYRVAELTYPNDYFHARMQFKREAARRLLEFSNVEVFDFELARDVTQDLDRYADMTHYDLATSTAMLHWIAEGRYRLTHDNLEDAVGQVTDASLRYATAVFEPEHPLHARMQIQELRLGRPAALSRAAASLQTAHPEGMAPLR